jgi:hypothetical protein
VKLRPPTNDFAARTDGSRRAEQVADELDAMDVALPHSLRAPNVALKAASHPLSIQSSLANKPATAPVCRLRDSGTDRFARHNAIANQSEVGGIVFFYRARLTPCPYYLRPSIRELKPFSSTAKRRGGVR